MTSILVPEPTDKGGLVWIETQIMGTWYQEALYRGYSIIWNPSSLYNLGLPKINPTGWVAGSLTGLKSFVDRQPDADPLPPTTTVPTQLSSTAISAGIVGIIIVGLYFIKKRRN